MPHRKLVQIGGMTKPPTSENLPTVKQYFLAMADRQGEDIRRLKEHAAAGAEIAPKTKTKKQSKSVVLEEGWRLHPTTEHIAEATSADRPPARSSNSPSQRAKKKHRVATHAAKRTAAARKPARKLRP